MRYNQDSHTSSLSLESSAQPSPIISLYPSSQTSVFNQPPPPYQPEGSGSFYPPSTHIFSAVDVRPRLGTNSNSPVGMAHAHRAQLPHPGTQITTRDLYSTSTPSFRRAGDHSTRSPSFPGSLRHHPLSPSPSPGQTFTAPFKMDSSTFVSKGQQNIPPLMDMTTFGTLQYADGPAAGSTAKLEINGTIDKGFFLADNEWTCYRRNYFSCVCSFNLTPHYPTSTIAYLPNSSSRPHNVHGFAMSISAAVSDNDTHVIELVQHTPKRDKGPTARPEKMPLAAKPPHAAHPPIGIYGPEGGMSTTARYDHSYGPPPAGYATEHTFERIQFKQATANNGKRRAAQQYYHINVELWADVGSSTGGEHYVKIAERKSAKMIVRGRSPGHYQSERRGSASSGPGGSAGSLGYGGSQVMGSDFGSAGSAILPGYGSAYDPRSANHYGSGTRHHQANQNNQNTMPLDPPIMSADEVKAITDTKEYQYYPTPICDSSHDPRQPVEMFSHSHHRSEHENALPHIDARGLVSLPKVKQETAHESLPQMFYAGSEFFGGRCGRFEGKTSSSGYYPTMILPTSSISMS